MDLLRRRRRNEGAPGDDGTQGGLQDGGHREGRDLMVRPGENADQALDRMIVEDLRSGALRRSRSAPMRAGLRRLTDGAEGSGGGASSGLPAHVLPPPGLPPGADRRGQGDEGRQPGEGVLQQGLPLVEVRRSGQGDHGPLEGEGRREVYGPLRPITLWPGDEHGPNQEQQRIGWSGQGAQQDGGPGAVGGWQWVPHTADPRGHGWEHRGGQEIPTQQLPQVNPFWSPEVQRRAAAAAMHGAEGHGDQQGAALTCGWPSEADHERGGGGVSGGAEQVEPGRRKPQ